MANVTVTRELEPTQGRYVGRIPGHDAEAELTFQRPNPRLFVADHTLTPVALRGRGIDWRDQAWTRRRHSIARSIQSTLASRSSNRLV